MPCFLAGSGMARGLSAVTGAPFVSFSHQQGHVAAALYGADKTAWLDRRFLAFHVSGGTTDALLVEPDGDTVLRCETVATSLDLKAGQLIDRVGRMLGLPFPAGPALERLALGGSGVYRPRPSLEDGSCHLSGVENQVQQYFAKTGDGPATAHFALRSIIGAIERATAAALAEHPGLPVVFSGGVASNSLLRGEALPFETVFAASEYSTDNAMGIALLAWLRRRSHGA